MHEHFTDQYLVNFFDQSFAEQCKRFHRESIVRELALRGPSRDLFFQKWSRELDELLEDVEEGLVSTFERWLALRGTSRNLFFQKWSRSRSRRMMLALRWPLLII